MEDDRTSYTMFSIFCTKPVCLKNYIYIIRKLRVILRLKIEGLSLEFDCLSWDNFEARLIYWYGRRLRRLTFSESRLNKNMLRKYIHQKEKQVIYMGLFTFMPGVQFLDLIYVEREIELISKKFEEKEKKRSRKEEIHKLCESNMKTVVKKFVSSENIYILILLDEFFLKKPSCQTNWSYSSSSFTKSV